MMSGLLQDWITFDSSGTASATQARGAWLDLATHSDVSFWLEVRAVSNPGAGNVTLSYETAPAPDDSLFQALATLTLAASSTPVITRVRLVDAAVPLARWVRWKLEGTASGSWSATFRVFATAGNAAGFRWTPAIIASQLAMWLDPSDAANRTIVSGKFSQLADKSGNGKTADQATSGLRPAVGTASINGLDTFRCTSSAAECFDLQDLSALTAGEAFMVRVVSADPPAVLYGTWQLGGGVGNAIPFTDGYIYDDCGSTAQHGLAGSAAGAFTSPHVYSVIATSSEWTNFLNGTQLYTTATNTVGFSAAGKLGTDSRGYGTDGDFGEIIVCNQKLSAPDRASMMTYLRAKWGTP